MGRCQGVSSWRHYRSNHGDSRYNTEHIDICCTGKMYSAVGGCSRDWAGKTDGQTSLDLLVFFGEIVWKIIGRRGLSGAGAGEA